MEENILPDDMQEMLLPEVSKIPQIKSVQFTRPDYMAAPSQLGNAPMNYAQNPMNYAQTPQPVQNVQNVQNVQPPQPPQNTNSVKKKNTFVKMSNNISKYPKCYLVLIILLILIILIIFIYYRGLLFLGPYCPNNVRSAKFKNREINKKDIVSSPKSKEDNLIKSLKL